MPRSNGGPRTQAGKAIASRNALKHGITSTDPVIPGLERQEDWLAHRDGISESLAPEGHLKRVLAERVASLPWRLNRVTRYEVAVTGRQVEDTVLDLALADAYLGSPADGELPDPDPEDVARAQQTRVIPAAGPLDKIMRYEAHLHRQWLQTLHELEALQTRRRGEKTHLARLDISLPPLS
jgi:hypothetical protein